MSVGPFSFTPAFSAWFHFTKRDFFCLALLCALASSTPAAVTPISVGPAGIGPITFDTLPGLADGWTTASWAGSASYPTNAAQMDAVVNTNNAADILRALVADTTATNAATMFGSTPSN